MGGLSHVNAGSTIVLDHVRVGDAPLGADLEVGGRIVEIGIGAQSGRVAIILVRKKDVIEIMTETDAEKKIEIIIEIANLESIVMKAQNFHLVCRSLCVKNRGNGIQLPLLRKVMLRVQSALLQKAVIRRRNVQDARAADPAPGARAVVKWTDHPTRNLRVRMESKTRIPFLNLSQMNKHLNQLLLELSWQDLKIWIMCHLKT